MEGVRDLNLNSKSEWNGSKIPRLVIEVKDAVKQTDHNGEALEKDKGKRTISALCNIAPPKKDKQLIPTEKLQVKPQLKL